MVLVHHKPSDKFDFNLKSREFCHVSQVKTSTSPKKLGSDALGRCWLYVEGFIFSLGAAEHQHDGRWTQLFRIRGQTFTSVVVRQDDLEEDG